MIRLTGYRFLKGRNMISIDGEFITQLLNNIINSSILMIEIGLK